MATSVVEVNPAAATEDRISWLTLVFGFAAGIAVAVLRSRIWGWGIAIGAALGWLNFRWLKHGLDALVKGAAAQAGRKEVRVPLTNYFGAFLRYALLALVVYVNFKYLNVPVSSMLVGMCALAAAVIAASLYEVFVNA
jgi:small-conductance mechanosensitive channel